MTIRKCASAIATGLPPNDGQWHLYDVFVAPHRVAFWIDGNRVRNGKRIQALRLFFGIE